MNCYSKVLKGRAVVLPEGLRCLGARPNDPEKICHKLLAKKTSSGQIAGAFKCDRCGQAIEVELTLDA